MCFMIFQMYDYAGKFHKNEAWKRFVKVEMGSRPGVEIYFLKRETISSRDEMSSFL